MADYVSVANLAMQKLGASDRIVDPDQASDVARSVKAAWDLVRQRCIRGGEKAPKWNFAMRYAELAARAPTSMNPVPYGWQGAFPVAAGSIRVVEVVRPDSCRWKVVGSANGTEILADTLGPLGYWYLVDVPEVGLWDPLFVDAFAARLAFQLADRITGGMERKSACYREWQDNCAQAASVDAKEDPPTQAEESDWVTSRWGEGEFGGGNVRWGGLVG